MADNDELYSGPLNPPQGPVDNALLDEQVRTLINQAAVQLDEEVMDNINTRVRRNEQVTWITVLRKWESARRIGS